MLNFTEIKELLEKYDTITIYRHFRADYDAYGSQLGLKYLLKLNYPEKKVYTCGAKWQNNPDFLEEMDNPEDEIIKNSLAVILDCSSENRIDDDRYKIAACSLKIDHHDNSDPFATYEYVDPRASATCLILGKICQQTGLKLDKKSASYLFAGLLTDTNNLSISDCTSEDFYIAGYLVSHDVDVNAVHRAVFSHGISNFIAEHQLASKFQFKEDKAWAIFNKEDYQQYGMPMLEAKEFVNLVKDVKGVECWVLFYQNEDGSYNASLRSHRKAINKVAEQFGGGGHLCASGISNMDEKLIPAVLAEFMKV